MKCFKKKIICEVKKVTVFNMGDVAGWCAGDIKGMALLKKDRVIRWWNKLHDMELEADVGDYIIKGTVDGFILAKKRYLKKHMR